MPYIHIEGRINQTSKATTIIKNFFLWNLWTTEWVRITDNIFSGSLVYWNNWILQLSSDTMRVMFMNYLHVSSFIYGDPFLSIGNCFDYFRRELMTIKSQKGVLYILALMESYPWRGLFISVKVRSIRFLVTSFFLISP